MLIFKTSVDVISAESRAHTVFMSTTRKYLLYNRYVALFNALW